MNSLKQKTKEKKPKEEPWFKFDPETGKHIPLPRKWLSPLNTCNIAGKDKLSENKNKKITVIAPLKLTAADFEESPSRPIKVRKIDNNSVRKELFNIPTRRSKICRPSIRGRQSLSERNMGTKKVQSRTFNPSELSPLLDMEEMEDELLNKRGCLQGYPFKTPSKPVFIFTKSNPTPKKGKSEKKNTPRKEIQSTPGSVSSNESEFLELEKMCGVENVEKENKYNESPISSVCNLLESTVINSIKKQKRMINTSMQTIVNKIETLLNENVVAFEQYKTSRDESKKKIEELLESDRIKYENLLVHQNENKNKIKEILSVLKSVCTETDDKENSTSHNRRSVRLLNKSPVQSNNAKLNVSPGIMRAGDLRKSTLTKNLVTKNQQIQSPRIQKALDMYNSMRNELTILATPKLDRKLLNGSPKSTNLSRTLSRRVQNQCILLQDTPVHK